MTQNLRKMAVVAGLAVMAVANSASAAVTQASSYTYSFKTFYDTSTILNPFDTKTLGYSVATLTLTDIAGGVRVTLSELSTDFPAKTTAGTLLDNLWLNGNWGNVSSVSGVGASGGATFLSLPTIVKDGGYVYNGNIGFAGAGITEGGTSVFDIKGTGVTAYNFAKNSNIPMIELSNVGGAYNTLLSGGKVNFIGTLSSVPSIPEPGTYALMGLGLAGVAFVSRRARRAA